jgi:hypothetical protein
MSRVKTGNILTISDLHIGYEHPKALEFICRLYDHYQPKVIVNLGDETDFYIASRYPKSTQHKGGEFELKKARKKLKEWFRIFPEMLLCTANHTVRHIKRAEEISLPSELFKTLGEIFDAPDTWQWAERWVIDDILFRHGDPYSGPNAARNMLADLQRNVVFGHLHTNAGVHYHTLPESGKVIWAASAGCLINPKTYAFNYSKTNRVKEVLGTIVIVNGNPIFEPLHRWVK